MTAPTSAQALLACLNASNDCDLPMEQIQFGSPIEPTNVAYNTRIEISAADESPFAGSGFYHYNRLELNLLDPGFSIEIDENDDIQTVGGIAEQLNAIWRVGLSPEDIDNWNDAIPEDGIVTLLASETSLAWIGSLTVTLSYGSAEPELPELSAVVQNIQLPPLTFQQG